MRYRISNDAENELEEIFLYWAERTSLAVADRVIDEIFERFRLLGEFPDAGRTSDDIAKGVKCFPAGPYLIYYRRRRAYTEIVHVFHGAREQKQAFKSSKKVAR